MEFSRKDGPVVIEMVVSDWQRTRNSGTWWLQCRMVAFHAEIIARSTKLLSMLNGELTRLVVLLMEEQLIILHKGFACNLVPVNDTENHVCQWIRIKLMQTK